MNVEEYVKKKVIPIFNKSLQETAKNRVSVGVGGFRDSYVFVQPHNCRAYFDFVKPVKPTLRRSVVVKNSSELMFLDLVDGCRVTIKRNTVEVVNLVDHEKRFIVPMKDSYGEFVRISVLKLTQCRKALKSVLEVFGGSSSGKVVNFVVQEWKIEHESFIDSIDKKAKFRNDVVKKEYDSSNVETSNAIYAANYLTNQAALMDDFNIVKWCEQNISCLDDVFKLESVIRTMSFDNKMFVSNFLFERFGGVLNEG